MSAIEPKKVLLVEGRTEKWLIPHLMEQREVDWEPAPKKYAVDIKEAGGLVTDSDWIGTQFKDSGLVALGIVFDADEIDGHRDNRWVKMQSCCRRMGIALPDSPPAEGFFIVLPSGIRFGAWMMPNNQPPGMLETFLLALLKPEEKNGALFQHAKASVTRAKELGAPFKAVHHDKALMHTWLAWQDQPGAQLHDAIKFKILDAASPSADGFVGWFKNLFQV